MLWVGSLLTVTLTVVPASASLATSQRFRSQVDFDVFSNGASPSTVPTTIANIQEEWIGNNWEDLQAKTLLELTLPGSHNSGNIAGELGSARLCESDYRYPKFIDMNPESTMSAEEFDNAFIPWNVNHDQGILQQLHEGIRWFHFKVCNFNAPDSESVDLSAVFHQHRGYTAHSLQQILDTMATFLADHPKEVLALGFNNLNQNSSPTVTDVEITGLSTAVKTSLAGRGIDLITEEDMTSTPLSALVDSGRRVAIFFKGDAGLLPSGVMASSDSLTENWDNSMSSGNLTAASAWLREDLLSFATTRGRFYVMQANPNDDDNHMLERINDGGQPKSLKTWEWNFLRSLETLVSDTVAEQPQVLINAVSSDFSDSSRVFVIAMRLMGLPGGFAPEVHTLSTNAGCLNPAVISGQFADSSEDSRYVLHASYVMQRHTDRWIYAHTYIDNMCWPGQLNSSVESSAFQADECDFGTRTLQTTWDTFPESKDPYAAPLDGTCQLQDGSTPQGTNQGVLHAKMLGEMLRERYVESGMLDASCASGDIALHADIVHKNELALQTEYEAICGRKPDIMEFSRDAVRVTDVPTKGTPWYLRRQACGGARLSQLEQEADAAKVASSWWTIQVASVAAEVANVAGHPSPESADYTTLLDNVMDCATVHACTGLPDTPLAFLGVDGLPDISGDSLYARMNRNETKSRVWPLDYFRAQSQEAFTEFASLYYGYFFAVLRDQLVAASQNKEHAPKLTISIMSDSEISPQLAFYNLSQVASQRPSYLSALVHELLRDGETGDFVIRAIYNGQVQQICPGKDLCPLSEWSDLLGTFIPDKDACPDLYNDYEFLSAAATWTPMLGLVSALFWFLLQI